MKKIFMFLSVMLILCISFVPLLGTVSASAFSYSAPEDVSAQKFIAPDIVEEAEATLRGYVGRVKEAEKDLSTFVFRNSDGSNTMRIYSHPVKYVDKAGKIRDISLKVKSNRNGSFVSADHEIQTTFGKFLSDGITLAYDGVRVTMIPSVPEGTFAAASKDQKTVAYKSDDKTSYEYSLTYAGYKEDIIVKEYTGETEYEFTLYTNGLTLCEEYGSYYLTDKEGTVQATIGDIIVFTANEKNNAMGRMSYKTVTENQEYRMVIHLDEEYLKDQKTVYPIRIDPTVELNYGNSGAGAIEDITINSLRGSNGTSGMLYVGRRETYGISRVLMRFPNLTMPVTFGPMILSAQVELRDVMCQDDEDMYIHCYEYWELAPAWTESGETSWNTVGNDYMRNYLSSQLVSYGKGNVSAQRYAFDITAAAQHWADGTNFPSKGLVFAAESAIEQPDDQNKYWYKTFASYNQSANKPSISIVYETKSVFVIANTTPQLGFLSATEPLNPQTEFISSIDDKENKKDRKWLWCIEYIEESGSYDIVSMGTRHPEGELPYVIGNNGSTVSMCPQDPESNTTRYIPVVHSDSTYFFRTERDTHKYLCRNTTANTLALTSVQKPAARFSLEKYDTDTFNCFFGGTYTNGVDENGVVHFVIHVDGAVLEHPLYANTDFESAYLWNGYTDRFIIHRPDDPDLPPDDKLFHITFKLSKSNYMKKGAHGVTIPNGVSTEELEQYHSEEEKELYCSNWESVTVYLNGFTESDCEVQVIKDTTYISYYNPFYTADEEYRQAQIDKVICHEMGHALKLAHPQDLPVHHEFPGCQSGYSTNNSVYAVMNSGFLYPPIYYHDNKYIKYSFGLLSAATPQLHDIINLISRWEYHANCPTATS